MKACNNNSRHHNIDLFVLPGVQIKPAIVSPNNDEALYHVMVRCGYA